MCLQKVISRKTFLTKSFFVGVLKVSDENSRIRIWIHLWEVRIRIRTINVTLVVRYISCCRKDILLQRRNSGHPVDQARGSGRENPHAGRGGETPEEGGGSRRRGRGRQQAAAVQGRRRAGGPRGGQDGLDGSGPGLHGSWNARSR